MTTLLAAAEVGDEGECLRAIEQGGDVNGVDGHGRTPLFMASWKGHRGVCALLLEHGANVHKMDQDGATALFMASQEGHALVCQALIDRGASLDQAASVWRCHPRLVSGAETTVKPGMKGFTPLYVAIYNGHTDVCALLLGRGANVDQAKQDGTTPLSSASQSSLRRSRAAARSRGQRGPS